MKVGTLIDPVTRTRSRVQINLDDFRAIQSAIGGYMYEAHEVCLRGQIVGTVYMAENRQALRSQASFAFEQLIVAGQRDHRIYGAALFVPENGSAQDDDTRCRFFEHAEAKEPALPVIRTMSDDALRTYITSGEAYERNASLISMNELAGDWAKEVGGNPDQTFVRHFEREVRDFIPRPVGTFNGQRCSIYELEAAFLGFYEWMRRKNTFRHDSPIGRAFNAPPFLFPDGLEPTTEEFAAGAEVEAGTLTLPFPMTSFWIIRWDVWLGGDGGGEGPALLHVEENHQGFTTREAFRDSQHGYSLGELQQHDRLRQVPCALITALHRINNRRQIIERGCSTPELDRINQGRAKSKHGLAPLSGFIRVTGRVPVGRGQSVGLGIERCRHDRRGHWRKRRNGVELAPHDWIRVRPSTIHPEKPTPALKPYVVV